MRNLLNLFLGRLSRPNETLVQETDTLPALNLGGDQPVFQPRASRFFVHPSERHDLEVVFAHLRAPAKDARDLIRRIALYVAATEKSEIMLPLTVQDPRIDLFLRFIAMAGLTCVFQPVKVDGLWLGRMIVFANGAELMADPIFSGETGADGSRIFVGVDKLWGGFPYAGLELKLGEASNAWKVFLGEHEIGHHHLAALYKYQFTREV